MAPSEISSLPVMVVATGTFGSADSSRTECALEERVVALFAELQQAEAVAERIGQHGNPYVGRVLGRSLELCASADSALDGCVHIVHDDVGMNRRPVPAIAPQIAARATLKASITPRTSLT